MTRDTVLLIVQSEVDVGIMSSANKNITSVHVSMLKFQRLCGGEREREREREEERLRKFIPLKDNEYNLRSEWSRLGMTVWYPSL